MVRGRRAGLVLLAALLTACAAAPSGSPPGSSPPPSPGSPSGSPSTGSTTVLRGALAAAFACTPADDQGLPAGGGALVPVPTRSVLALLMCPLTVPTGSQAAVMVSASSPGFPALLALLSAPDRTHSTLMCPMYADQPQVILARTADAAYVVKIPVDGCGHYQHPEVLSRLRGR